MGDLDSNIANGTCYYAYNEAAGDELVPCGNGGIDHVSCCFGGDYCDADNTCYDESTGNTYLAGCTDSQYTDSSCPWKSDDFDEQEWVGLIRCDAVDETANQWAWAGCSVPTSAYTSLERLPGSCDCDDKATLFVGEQALTRHASLPGSTGGTISWVEGFAVTAAATGGMDASASRTSASRTGTAAATASATGSGTAESAGDAGLSAGTKAAIAGSVVGVSLVLAILALVVFLHKRKRACFGTGKPASRPPADGGTLLVKADDKPPPAYSDGRPMELEATALKSSVRATELAADDSVTPHSTPNHLISGTPVGVTPELAPSEFGDTRRHSMVSAMSGSDENGGLFISSAPASPPRHSMPSISELPG